MKTSKQIQGDIIKMLKGTQLAKAVTGKIYRDGYRPRDSEKEDIIVTFTTGINAEIQQGTVTINIYVADKDFFANGVFAEDGQRTAEIELLAQNWADALTANKSDYLFELQQTIYTESADDIKQHFVVLRLGYKIFELSNN